MSMLKVKELSKASLLPAHWHSPVAGAFLQVLQVGSPQPRALPAGTSVIGKDAALFHYPAELLLQQ